MSDLATLKAETRGQSAKTMQAKMDLNNLF